MASSKPRWQKGTVHWFDPKSGEGMIRGADGNVYYVNATAIDDLDAAQTSKAKALRDKQNVEFQLIEDTTFVQVSRVKEV